jgi:hypothetical protein
VPAGIHRPARPLNQMPRSWPARNQRLTVSALTRNRPYHPFPETFQKSGKMRHAPPRNAEERRAGKKRRIFEGKLSEWGCGSRDRSGLKIFECPPRPRVDMEYITEPLLEGVQPEHHQ